MYKYIAIEGMAYALIVYISTQIVNCFFSRKVNLSPPDGFNNSDTFIDIYLMVYGESRPLTRQNRLIFWLVFMRWIKSMAFPISASFSENKKNNKEQMVVHMYITCTVYMARNLPGRHARSLIKWCVCVVHSFAHVCRQHKCVCECVQMAALISGRQNLFR